MLKSSSLRRQCSELEAVCCFLHIIKDSCRYSSDEISGIISGINDSSLASELTFVKKLQDEKLTVKELGSSTETLNDTRFSQEDKEHISSFFAYLGTTDREGQLENCKRHLEYFEKRFSKEKELLPSKIRVFSSLSFCGSAVLALMLI